MKKEVSEKVNRIADGVLAMAGVYLSPAPGTQPAGVSKTGAAVFVATTLASSDNTQAGAGLGHALAAFVNPFKVLSKKEKDELDRLSATSSNPKLIAVLDKAHQERKGEEFAATFIKALGRVTSDKLAVIISIKLYDHWGVISPAQKSLSIMAAAIQTHKTAQGGAVCDLVIVSGHGMIFTVRDALNLVQQGKNPYPLVANWDQFYRLTKVYNDKPTVEGMLDFAVSHNMLGKGVTDAAVPQVSKEGIERSGSKPAPQYGVGALAAPSGAVPPDGYTTVAEMPGGNVIVPERNGATAVGAVSGSLVGTKAGVQGISGDAAGVYAKWDKRDAKARDKGATGGSSLVAGLNDLSKTNPYLYSAMIAFLARYSYGKIDASNPAAYLASLAGISLARIVSGKAEDKADSEGVAIAQSVQTGSPADFAKMQINIRAMYANFGVSSKADAFQLSNQAFSEGRINESDLVAMQQIYDVVYDNASFGILGKLLEGRAKGLEVAKMDCYFKNTMDTKDNTDYSMPTGVTVDVRSKNRAKYAAAPKDQPQEVTPSVV